jgi:hypothetical protein
MISDKEIEVGLATDECQNGNEKTPPVARWQRFLLWGDMRWHVFPNKTSQSFMPRSAGA